VGSFLVAQYANDVTGVDIDEDVISFCVNKWAAPNINWACGDVLSPGGLSQRFFDVVLAMETIEHFSIETAAAYIANVEKHLKEGGVLVGTSAFPASRAEADAILARNPHHLHIFTEPEILSLLRRHFSRAVVIGGWMFMAIK